MPGYRPLQDAGRPVRGARSARAVPVLSFGAVGGRFPQAARGVAGGVTLHDGVAEVVRMQVFRDRDDGGRRLADRLLALRLRDPVVLTLPRGGVPVGRVVAERLGAPLDVTVVRKITSPDFPETAVGAVTAEGAPIINDRLKRMVHPDPDVLADSIEKERAEARRRVEAYRGARPAPRVAGRDVVVVDDGLATGMSARAALSALREQGPASLTLAVPVCSPEAADALGDVCDRVVCVLCPPRFQAVSLWYESFPQVDDAEVQRMLAGAGA
ncbi:hypothetical protein GCM10023224_43800 [Streptomonospora halophila]|uniref:Phosphoribosyltransferase domain-containing protein n=1 Tax=Streptomonospora halophila TaxID=427369 RepID=A0ABP9GY80_9ACTN